MRIGIDARELCGHPTGVGRYLLGLLREWARSEVYRRHDFVLYAPGELAISVDSRRLPTRIIAGGSGTWWEQARVPRVAAADHVDVWFAPAYTAPLFLSAPIVATIHDVSFAAHPEWFRMREGLRRRVVTRATARQARTVITVSEFSKREIVELLGVGSEKVRVIPQGIDPPAVTRDAGGREPRVLYAGSIFNRRHVPDLIRGVALLSRQHPKVSLDIVGDNRTFPREDIDAAVAAHGSTARIEWHRYATQEHLADLYGQARAFAFLSEYEGLGMTPLEALAVGIPPVVLDTAAARETLGDAAVYVPADHDVPAVARGLETALFDETVRARILAAAPAALAKFNWARAARDVLSVLEAAAQAA